jgi:hypothetical protein
MSVALLKMICRTMSGVGDLLPCALRYASMTRAATPAVSGADSLVPPKPSRPIELPPLAFSQSVYVEMSVEQSAQFKSPGAMTSGIRRSSVTPELDNVETSLLSQPGVLCPRRYDGLALL